MVWDEEVWHDESYLIIDEALPSVPYRQSSRITQYTTIDCGVHRDSHVTKTGAVVVRQVETWKKRSSSTLDKRD